ncbi:MAG: ammonium transporter [Planctomycetaceae bacterium]
MRCSILAFCLLLFLLPAPSFAQDDTLPAAEPAIEAVDAGATAWVMTSSALVLMMTLPGLALFYGGLVRKKNILSVMMQCVFLAGMMSVIWAVYGYSFAFGGDGKFFGNFDHILLEGVIASDDGVPMSDGLPTSVFMVFQMMFFIITPALICGAFAERMKFSAMCVFMALWGTIVYCPVAHWVWGTGGWLLTGEYEALDFAGGTVVHITSGASALVCALVLGKRLGYGSAPMPPHNLTYTAIGTGLLWVGWFGFNAGSALAPNASAANAFVATHLAAAAGVLSWSICEWIKHGRASLLGGCSGAVAGLVCITPAAGAVNPIDGIVLGLIAGVVCYFFCTTIKNKFNYDDSLDAFGVHGVGGTVGAVLTGVFARKAITGGASGVLESGMDGMHLLRNQVIGVIASAAIAVVVTFILLKIIDVTIGLRVDQESELKGLDTTEHGEEGYNFY